MASGAGAVGLSGLDGFGRVADLHYRNGAGQTLYRSEHAYDAAGNVRWSRLTQSSTGGTPVVNARSTVNQYDQLNPLVKVNQAMLGGGTTPTIVASVLVKQYTYDGLRRHRSRALPGRRRLHIPPEIRAASQECQPLRAHVPRPIHAVRPARSRPFGRSD